MIENSNIFYQNKIKLKDLDLNLKMKKKDD